VQALAPLSVKELISPEIQAVRSGIGPLPMRIVAPKLFEAIGEAEAHVERSEERYWLSTCAGCPFFFHKFHISTIQLEEVAL